MNFTHPIINNDWDIILKDDFQKKSFIKLMQSVNDERKMTSIFPLEKKIFNAFKLTPFSKTKIIILGQDPYHGEGQADGLAFSVPNRIPLPPSLKNIFKELANDTGITIPKNGNLKDWAKQGVLLLNTTLTVRKKDPKSHQKLGWKDFTDSVISKLSLKKSGLIFMLWGELAHKKSSLINIKKHHILKASHPSPLSAYKGFIGCKHFSRANKILKRNNQKTINWNLCKDTLTLF